MARTLLSLYPHNPRRYDEMLDALGRVRPHWQEMFAHLEAASPELMRQRLEFVDRRIQENGVTYNVYADPSGADRPWALDPLPLILAADEWQQIAGAVAQRAKVIDATLADLYGEQKLLAEGLVPPALVYGQHGYLWPCQGVKPPGGRHLHVYAADLARSPDGRWWVIADRTQAPSGAGYALENRLVISRVFPDQFRDLEVQHLAYFFRALQDSLAQWAPVDPGEQPHIVLLTPGPYNETYFEHAYLARYLGFPLVEGQDLTVRGDAVYLKTVTGLKRVHVILRRQDDGYCDPLELRGDSALGVPGLLSVVRAGRVLVANALGSGMMASGALMGFLPGICRRLLGEELQMPSVATWWCGEKPAMDYVLENLDKLVIKASYPTQRLEPVFGSELKDEAREEMIRRLQARPHAYLGQEMVRLSQAPVWSRNQDRRMLARAVGLRVFAVATPEGYLVMPGGLARVANGPNALVISMQRGGMSKDAWVLADGQVNTLTLLKSTLSTRDLVRSGSNLTSRVVENLFWLGRYSERFDDTARVLRVALGRYIDSGGLATPELDAVLDLCQRMKLLAPLKDKAEAEPAPGRVASRESGRASGREPAGAAKAPRRYGSAELLQAIYDPNWPTSLANNIRSLLWSATQVRERLSLDNWHSLNALQRELQGAMQRPASLGEALSFLDKVLVASSSLTGFALDNMTRDDGWRFLIVGRRLERLDFLASTIAEFLRMLPSRGTIGLEWLLELMDSIITYRSRYLRQPELMPVLDLIVYDDDNPHSVMLQVKVINNYLVRLGRNLGHGDEPALKLLSQRLTEYDLERLAGVEQCSCGKEGPCLSLADLLEDCAEEARQLSDRLSQRFFTHVGMISRQTLAN